MLWLPALPPGVVVQLLVVPHCFSALPWVLPGLRVACGRVGVEAWEGRSKGEVISGKLWVEVGSECVGKWSWASKDEAPGA